MPNLELRSLLEELLEKWRDVSSCAEDMTETTLADEMVDDLKRVFKCLPKN